MILYNGKCRLCGFQVHSIYCDVFKRLMAEHMNKSHQGDYVFVAEIPITDFRDHFVIIRIRHTGEVKTFLSIVNNPAYWKVIRKFPKIQNTLFSGLSNGENSLSEILRQISARG